jgi:hypothetical protein
MVTSTSLALAETKENFKAASARITEYNQRMAEWQASWGGPILERLAADTNGRLAKAFSTNERITRWGKHYAAALMRSHQLQLCTNFMDPGLQAYKGENFLELSEQGGRIFVSLPAPVPQKVVVKAFTSTAPASKEAPATLQNYYAGEGGGCFAGQCVVLRLQGESCVATCVRDVRPGDMLAVAGEGFARVKFVAEIVCLTPLVPLEGGLLLTPSHPIRVDGVWLRPKHLSSRRVANSEQVVYNFVLESNHVLLVNGVECVTWGHGLTDPTVTHEFYGSMKRVTNALAQLKTSNGITHVQQSLRL